MLDRYVGENIGKHQPGVFGPGVVGEVTYLDDAGRAAYRITARNGKLYSGRRLFDTGQGRAIFVEGPDGSIYAKTMTNPSAYTGRFHHSSFLGGRPVAMAGEMRVHKGNVLGVNNSSGHYRPTQMDIIHFLQRLERSGVTSAKTAQLLPW